MNAEQCNHFVTGTEPWDDGPLQDRFDNWAGNKLSVVGDIDGDGHIEYALIEGIKDALGDRYSYLTFFGHSSFIAPEVAGIGEHLGISLFVPAYPLGRWKLLLSSHLSPGAGQEIDGWVTEFSNDWIYGRTWNAGPSGRLDSSGMTEIVLTLPNQAALRGLKLYGRAAVQDQNRPNKIATLTNISVITVM